MEPEGFEPSSSRCSLGFCVSNLPNPHGCNRRTHAAAPRRLYRPSRYSLWMETAGVEPASSSVQARCSAGRASSPGVAMRTGGVEPPQPEAAGLQPVELSLLSVRVTWGDRPDSNRYRELHRLGCCVTPRSPCTGTTGLEPAASRLTNERSARLSYAPMVD